MKIVVTGATKGIGRATVLKFASAGFDVAFCARNPQEVHSLSDKILENNPRLDVIAAVSDLSKKDEVLDFAHQITSKWQHLDVLVNNAGVFIPGEICNEEDGLLDKMIQTNLYSAYNLTRELLPLMLRKNKGHIFNMCSVASLYAYPNGGSYSISKFALYGFSKVLREELKEKGIKVTSVLPGATWTNSWAGSGVSPERLMDASDIAETIFSAFNLGPACVVEDILLRPQLGDI
jgi:short-subunit dehydrogenase